jgi:hypothetical protein
MLGWQVMHLTLGSSGITTNHLTMAKYAQGFTLLKLDNPNFRDAFEEVAKTDPTFFDEPYFTDMTSAYTQFRFYTEATPLELERAGKEFFQGPIIFDFGEEQWQSFSRSH